MVTASAAVGGGAVADPRSTDRTLQPSDTSRKPAKRQPSSPATRRCRAVCMALLGSVPVIFASSTGRFKAIDRRRAVPRAMKRVFSPGKLSATPSSTAPRAATMDARADERGRLARTTGLTDASRWVPFRARRRRLVQRPWLFLAASTIFEVVWIVSLKMSEGFARFLPLLV